MSRVSINDYQKSALDNGAQMYTLIPDTVKKYGKKKTAGVPKIITVHMPKTKEAQLRTDKELAEGIAEAVGKMLGV